MLADLHVHTTASDGADSPEEVVFLAASMGLAALAVTDHDTLEGIQPAVEEGRRRGLEVLPAIEMGTEYKGREVHVLGYSIDVTSGELLAELDFFRRTRLERVSGMVRKLNRIGFGLALRRVLEIAGTGSVGRPHIARAMIEAGMAESVEEAFDLYLGEGKPAFEPRLKYSPARAVGLIRRAGGVAVLAHPGLTGADELIPSLVPEGLQGIEVYHPGNPPGAVEHYLGICRKYGLLATGGSDYHGSGSRKYDRPGACAVSYRVVEQIKMLTGADPAPGVVDGAPP